MAPFLITQLQELADQVRPAVWKQEHDWKSLGQEAERLTALALDLFRQIEDAATKKQSPDPQEWDAAVAREFVPAFTNWLEYANEVKALRRECKAHGLTLDSAAEFFHAINRSKIFGPDLDRNLELLNRMDEPGYRGIPFLEVVYRYSQDETTLQIANIYIEFD